MSDEHIRGMIANIDAYRKPDRSLAEHLLIMDLQALREIIEKEKKAEYAKAWAERGNKAAEAFEDWYEDGYK